MNIFDTMGSISVKEFAADLFLDCLGLSFVVDCGTHAEAVPTGPSNELKLRLFGPLHFCNNTINVKFCKLKCSFIDRLFLNPEELRRAPLLILDFIDDQV